jgi:hypothetical protein
MRPWLASKGYDLYQYQPASQWNLDKAPLYEAASTCYIGEQELPYAFLDDIGEQEIRYEDGAILNSRPWHSETTCRVSASLQNRYKS